MLNNYDAHNSLLPFYLAWQSHPEGSDYNLCFSYKFENNDQVTCVATALQKLVKRNAYLRQTYLFENNQIIVNIHDDLPPEINYHLCSVAAFSQFEQTLIKEPHQINLKSSIKLHVVRFSDCNSHIVIFNIHHINMDSYTLNHFILDLNRIIMGAEYPKEDAGQRIMQMTNEPSLKQVGSNGNLAEYIAEINEITTKMDFFLEGNQEKVLHTTDILPVNTQEKLVILSKKELISTFNLLLLAWGIFTAKLSNQQFSLIDYPVNIRSDKSIKGCFINMGILPIELTENATYISLIKSWQCKAGVVKALKTKIMGHLKTSKIPSFSESSYVFPNDIIIMGKQYTAKSYPQIASANVSLKYTEKNNEHYFSCDILSGIFPNLFVAALLPRFFNFLDKLLVNPSAFINTFSLTFAEEKKQILTDFNNTKQPYPRDKTLVDLFVEQVEKNPKQVALSYEGECLTYGDLNKKSNQLANYLKKKGMKEGKYVAICSGHDFELVISILAILKLGAAYIPIDPNAPAQHINLILEDSLPEIILVRKEYEPRITSAIANNTRRYQTLNLNEIQDFLNSENDNNIPQFFSPESVAYIIYTSGSTGKPKGVMVAHYSISRLIINTNYINIMPSDRIAQAASIGFDAATFEIWGALLNGACLIGVSRDTLLNAALFSKFLKTESISALWLTSALFNQYISTNPAMFSYLKYLLVGGDILNMEKIKTLLECPQGIPKYFLNGYGPTESTTFATTYLITKETLKKGSVPIGKPIANTTVYVLDEWLNPVPIGIPGELYIGGDGLAIGYLNQEILTDKKFIPNPFIKGAKEKLYKTGDSVCWSPDGSLEFLGRKDNQIKIRGFRVELDAVQSHILQYKSVSQCIVKSYSNPEQTKTIVAYLIPTNRESFSVEQVREYLNQHLPSYMIPSSFVVLDKFPVTQNGKIDYNVLTASKIDNEISESIGNTAENKIEKIIANIWKNILEVPTININDNFFDAGGNSLLLMVIHSNLEKAFKRTIPVNILFTNTTIKELANYFSSSQEQVAFPLQKARTRAEKRLLALGSTGGIQHFNN